MKVQSECLEILNYLLNVVGEIACMSNTKELNADDTIKVQCPLNEWGSILKKEGFNPQLLQEFILSAEVNQLW